MSPDPPLGQLWECNSCGLIAEWHPAEEGGYYCHCRCSARSGVTFIGYEEGYGPEKVAQTSTDAAEDECPPGCQS